MSGPAQSYGDLHSDALQLHSRNSRAPCRLNTKIKTLHSCTSWDELTGNSIINMIGSRLCSLSDPQHLNLQTSICILWFRFQCYTCVLLQGYTEKIFLHAELFSMFHILMKSVSISTNNIDPSTLCIMHNQCHILQITQH